MSLCITIVYYILRLAGEAPSRWCFLATWGFHQRKWGFNQKELVADGWCFQQEFWILTPGRWAKLGIELANGWKWMQEIKWTWQQTNQRVWMILRYTSPFTKTSGQLFFLGLRWKLQQLQEDWSSSKNKGRMIHSIDTSNNDRMTHCMIFCESLLMSFDWLKDKHIHRKPWSFSSNIDIFPYSFPVTTL